jgi:polyribonucleotide nucleotidyltransferase
MDFKVAGTANGVTALQMDIKIEGINERIMEVALEQAQQARLHILAEMNRVIDKPRDKVSDNAPSMQTMKVHPDKIRDVIGKGGATIRGITEQSGAEIDIDDDGTVRIFAPDGEALRKAVALVESVTSEAEVGAIYEGKVIKIVDFGAFINILPGKDGLVHISQISDERVETISDFLTEGQTVKVKVLDVDNRGRIKLSMKEIAQ